MEEPEQAEPNPRKKQFRLRAEEAKSTKDMKSKVTRKMKIAGMHIVVMDSEENYCKMVVLTIMHGLTQLMLGAVNVVVLGYTISTSELHAFFCCLAWHFFTIEAIIAMNFTPSWGNPMNIQHKKLVHMILQIVALIFLVCGCALVLLYNKQKYTAHGLLGVMGLVMTVVTVVSGPIALLQHQNVKIFHTCVAVPTFLITSSCLILAFVKGTMQLYAGKYLCWTLIFFIVFYSIFLTVTIIIKCSMRKAFEEEK